MTAASPVPVLLRAQMAKLRLTIDQAAEKAKISRAGLYLLLSDKANPTLETLQAIRTEWPYPDLLKDLDAFL